MSAILSGSLTTQSKYKPDVLAYHEAGHAAAACFLHLPFTGVHTIAAGDLLGALELAPVNLTPGKDADEFERRIVHSFAGPVAQARHTGKLDWQGGSRDFENAWKMAHLRHAEKDSLREVSAFLSYCWVRAHELVWMPSRWAAIKALALVLVDAQRLTESEATRVMMEAAQPLMLADSSAQAEDYQAALDNRSLQLLMRSQLRTLRR
jgi:hypothetical protein